MLFLLCFFCNDTATTEIYTSFHTLSLHDALPISVVGAEFFADPEFTRRTGSGYDAIELIKNRHRFVDRDDVLRARKQNPSDLVMWHFLDVEEIGRAHV